ncbi:hydroxyacid dehydrogenase [Roseinatronobacter alkalisoli]|uniref:Hydroxyacid dehydrogenase n=1 Tax=Roseinatronobacter alkalisoli TaxID=3028235 RepID=A0ABT5TE23_9RHOB|nr:hydroxyacid dehydrogenase [Roseinatronobacter sp. HJB301]MDD7973266.1 hydroxyacid dehydrogenase [Roseinatronobacter sp. HJB301]
MSKSILVTGPNLHPDAVRLATASGYALHYAPPYASPDQLVAALAESGAAAIIARMGRIDAAVMDAAPGLRVISKHGAGVDNIDLDAAAARGIPVLAATGANAISVAEHAIALILGVVKRLGPLDAGLRAGRWEKPEYSGRELAGLRLGLLGMGAIAQATARMACGLGLKLHAFDPFAPDDAFARIDIDRCKTLAELLRNSDILSLHCPLNDATRAVVNAANIAQMPARSYVINTARGGLIDEDALLEAIRSGHLAGAGLDTFAVEPPPANHPFLSDPRVLVTPHIGGVTDEANARVGTEAVSGIIDMLEGREIPAHRIMNRHLLAQLAPATGE